MKIVIIGSGYVGLVSGACFAAIGHTVICVDSNEQKIELLKAGGVPIFEPGLDKLIAENVEAGRLEYSNNLSASLQSADFAFIAVGTPTRRGGSEADLTMVYAVAEEVAKSATDGLVIVTKSTVPVGTGEAVELIVKKARPDLVFSAVSNPEFLKEGTAIADFMSPDRVVVGSNDAWATEKMRMLYRPLTDKGVLVLYTGRNAAEVIKYAANAFLATKIAFINEIADFCEVAGADVVEVANGIGTDSRIGRAFLNPGPGYGGSCFPKDSLALLATAHSHSVNLRVVESSIAANDARKRGIGRRIATAFGQPLRGKTVAVLGLTFKANTDDMREAPSIDLISSIQKMGASVKVFDPEGMEQARHYLRDVQYCENPYECASECDGVVIATEWKLFRELDFARLSLVVKGRTIVDLRNVLDIRNAEAAGFDLHRLGVAKRAQALGIGGQARISLGSAAPRQQSEPVVSLSKVGTPLQTANL